MRGSMARELVGNKAGAPSAKLKLKVVPGASGSGISGWLGDALKIRVAAPPEKGKANAAVATLVCEALGLPHGAARIVSGGNSLQKVIEVRGLSHSEILERISRFAGP